MTVWAAVAAAYGIVLAVAALAKPIQRRAVAAAACAAYALAAIGSGTLPRSLWVELFTPAVLLLAGYWLSGFFFRDPQPWLEAFLLRSDSQLMDRAGLKGWLQRSPRWVLEALEASYAADYAVVGVGAIVAAQHGVDAVTGYWSLVLSAELACYVALPWLRSRPPRALETARRVRRASGHDAAAECRDSRPRQRAGEHDSERACGGSAGRGAGGAAAQRRDRRGAAGGQRRDRRGGRRRTLSLRRRLRRGRVGRDRRRRRWS